jgi:predicted MFS family arabinose efflux permease
VFVVLVAAVTAYSSMQSLVIPALPQIQDALGTTTAATSWVVTALLLSSVVAAPTLGRLGDLYGTRPTLLVALGALVLGTVVCATAGSLPQLILGRALHGIGAAVFPLSFAIVRRTMPAARAPWAYGLLSGMLGVGGAIGVPLGGLIAAQASWPVVFWALLPVYLVVLAAAWRLVPHDPRRTGDAPRIDVLGGVLMAVGLVALLVSVTEGEVWGWTSPGLVAGVVVATVALTAWVQVELRRPAPMIDVRQLVRPTTWRAHAIAFAYGAGLYCSFALLPSYLQDDAGLALAPASATLMLVPFPLTMSAIGLATGRLVARRGPEAVLAAGSLLSIAGFVTLMATPSSTIVLLVAIGVLGLGIGAGFSVLPDLVTREAHADDTGAVTGVNTVMRFLGGAICGQLAAVLVAHGGGHGFAAGFAVGLVMLLLAAGLTATIRRSAA